MTQWFRRHSLWLVMLIVMTVNILVGASVYTSDRHPSEKAESIENVALFTTVMEQVRAYYVDEEKTPYKKLVNGALQGMLESLDPHCQFLDEDMYEDLKDDTQGHFGGLGIVVSTRDGVLTVVAPMEDTPGYAAGLLTGDRIMEIDGVSTEGLQVQDAVKNLRGEPGTPVKLKILRPSDTSMFEVNLTRAIINIRSVKDTAMLDERIGYVRVTSFNEPTAEDLQAELEKLLGQGMKALVLDLRGNPGGLLSAAKEISEKFLKPDDLIVYTQGRSKSSRRDYVSEGRHHYGDFPMVILVNGGSASASEIVAGALQDHKRALLVGERSFGKGSVQSLLPLDNGMAVRLTTAKYYTPSERVIHNVGIQPDIEVRVSPDEWRALQLKRSKPAAYRQDLDIHNAGLPKPADVPDRQLERAMDVLKGILAFRTHAGDKT
jgi:carboxyl-terminal processing protease